MRRWLSLVGMLAWTGTPQAQDRAEVKPDGTRVTTRQVPLFTQLPTACIALNSQDGTTTIVISRDEVDRLATRNENAVDDKVPRMEFLASARARDLLKLLSNRRDSRGCEQVRGQLPMDTSYLAGWLLEQGQAVVFTRHLHLPEPVILVRKVDGRLSGYEDFVLQDGTVI